MSVRASVILPTLCLVPETAAILERCLDNLFKHTNFNGIELIVFEQGKKYALEMISKRSLVAYPEGLDLHYCYNEAPVGYATAVNAAIENSKGDYLFILNNDIDIQTTDWIDKLIKAYVSRPNIGMLSPAVGFAGDVIDGQIDAPSSWWSCVCISRAVWNKVGRLDMDKLNYRLHDQDWSARAHRMGLLVGRYRGVCVQHDSCSTYKHMNIDETHERFEMRRRWGFEHFSDYVQTVPVAIKVF